MVAARSDSSLSLAPFSVITGIVMATRTGLTCSVVSDFMSHVSLLVLLISLSVRLSLLPAPPLHLFAHSLPDKIKPIFILKLYLTLLTIASNSKAVIPRTA